MLEYRFESQLGLEFSDFCKCHFLKLVIRGFFYGGTPVSSPPSSVNDSAKKKKKKEVK